MDLFQKHRTVRRRYLVLRKRRRRSSISRETAAAKGGQLGGRPKEAATGKGRRLKRFEQIFIDIFTKLLGFMCEEGWGGGLGAKVFHLYPH